MRHFSNLTFKFHREICQTLNKHLAKRGAKRTARRDCGSACTRPGTAAGPRGAGVRGAASARPRGARGSPEVAMAGRLVQTEYVI